MKKETNPKFRHELKYRISKLEKDSIVAKIKEVVKLDNNAKNGKYTIRSLYFDDMWNSSYEEKLSGISYRKKYRIRVYDCSDNLIKLEKKNKQGQYIYKESVVLTRSETEKILQGDYNFLLHRGENLCKEFYVQCKTSGMRPKVIVDYDRIPFVYKPGDVRITFDIDLRAGMLNYNLFDPILPTIQVLKPEELIMEVKFTEFLPQIIRNILPPEYCELIAASKYVMCYDRKYGIINY